MVVTNMLGVAFTATLLAASDAGVTFVFPEDGATNTLDWTQLSSASQDAVCAAADFAPVPAELAATLRLAETEMRRVAALEADRRLDSGEVVRRRKAIVRAFENRCREKGLPPPRLALLVKRLRSR